MTGPQTGAGLQSLNVVPLQLAKYLVPPRDWLDRGSARRILLFLCFLPQPRTGVGGAAGD